MTRGIDSLKIKIRIRKMKIKEVNAIIAMSFSAMNS
jgi:hypothetical protein